ncbi:hypothetical protein PsYK624_167610 [Phanerochaete sordida]|uniref:CCHC-type domain-containing protein n=1 Tax=Phanerochaete sordida TaxID=48140 RepID=A0A9P3GRE3_9APHY|nr:hypothetical protein PsYK624_167610 [Phanerochaete sordida]
MSDSQEGSGSANISQHSSQTAATQGTIPIITPTTQPLVTPAGGPPTDTRTPESSQGSQTAGSKGKAAAQQPGTPQQASTAAAAAAPRTTTRPTGATPISAAQAQARAAQWNGLSTQLAEQVAALVFAGLASGAPPGTATAVAAAPTPVNVAPAVNQVERAVDDPVPGFVAPLTSKPVPPKIVKIFQSKEFCAYKALTPAGLTSALANEDHMVMSAAAPGVWTSKAVESSNDRGLSSFDWDLAAAVAEDLSVKFWSRYRTGRLREHHRNVRMIRSSHGWPVALEYCINTRESAAADPNHDLGLYNFGLLASIATRPEFLMVAAAKRAAVEDNATRPAKRAKGPVPRAASAGHCFRCGRNGHTSFTCTAATTVAGKPPASIIENAGGRKSLAPSAGGQYCFGFMRTSTCARDRCGYVHGCAICTDPDHVIETLKALNLLDDWGAVVDGLQNGFDVGASAPIPHSLLFPNHASAAMLHPTSAVRKDLERIADLLRQLPNSLPLARAEPLDLNWWGDASTSFGIGVTVGTFWAAWQWAPGFLVGPRQAHDIGWAEALAVELGLLLAIHHGLLRDRSPHASRLLVRSDNMGVVAVVNGGRSRSGPTNLVLKRIYSPRQHHGRSITRRLVGVLERYAPRHDALRYAHSTWPLPIPPVIVMAVTTITIPSLASLHQVTAPLSDRLIPRPSSLRPPCRADQRLFQWHGVNAPPPSTLQSPILQRLADLASAHSLRDAGSYGSGLRKYHLFCDVFSVPEHERLPASFPLLHSFALWAVADQPDPEIIPESEGIPFEPVAPATARKYLSAVCAWHLAQGWPNPLSAEDHRRINWSLRGLTNMQGARKRPPRPPITLQMLVVLRLELDLDDPFDACVWAMACCAFWGLMRFGEVSVKSRSHFDPDKHLTRADAHYGVDIDGYPFFRLHLPSAKTAQPGDVQEVHLSQQGFLCPHDALFNLHRVVPATASDPLFSWRDAHGDVRPMVRARALERINGILGRHGWGTTFGHSFRIGGASFLLSQGVSPEIVRILGRWRSLAYEVYIRAFEQAASRHVANLSQVYGL